MDISLLFCGDFSPTGRYKSMISSKGGSIFGGLRDCLSSVDLGFVNIEAPLYGGGAEGVRKSGPRLRAEPGCAAALSDAGFRLAGLANNHIMDYGAEGLTSTLEACAQHGLIACGAGENATEAAKPIILSVKDVRIGIIAVAEMEFNAATNTDAGSAICDPMDITNNILNLRKNVDIIVVTMHGGNEYVQYPRPGMRKLCKYLIDVGANAVVCHHSHVQGAYEIYNESPIVYGLGNLLFDCDPAPEGWNEGYAANITFSRRSDGEYYPNLEIIPFSQSVKLGGVVMPSEKEKLDRLLYIENLANNLQNHDVWMGEWHKYCMKNRNEFIAVNYIPLKFRGIGWLTKIFKLDRAFLPQWSVCGRRNLIQCDSHREVMLYLLNSRPSR